MTVFLQLALVTASLALATQTSAPRPLAFWQAIAANGMSVPEDESAYELIVELSGHLGSPDSVLRDDYGYGIPTNWIRRQQLLSDDELRSLADLWLGNLSVGVGDMGDESVLLRSFSALNLSMLAAYDNKHPFLDEDGFNVMLEGTLIYAEQERDLRGWVKDVGWCHSAAHTADLFKFLGRSRHLQPEGQTMILEGIGIRLRNTGGYVFVHGEDDRLAAAVVSLIARGDFDLAAFRDFIQGFKRTFGGNALRDGFNVRAHAAQQNSRNFLGAVYIRLSRAGELTPDQAAARELLLAALPKR